MRVGFFPARLFDRRQLGSLWGCAVRVRSHAYSTEGRYKPRAASRGFIAAAGDAMKMNHGATSFELFALRKKWKTCLEDLEGLRMELNALAERDFSQTDDCCFSDETRAARNRFDDYCNDVLLPLAAQIDAFSIDSEGRSARNTSKNHTLSTRRKL